MTNEAKIVYEPHPVSDARRDELRVQGYRIVDAAFAPAGAVIGTPAEPAPVAKTEATETVASRETVPHVAVSDHERFRDRNGRRRN